MKQNSGTEAEYDIVVVGAGFAGLYALHRFRKAGYRVRVIEAGSDIGGTWFWNRYPGARCDIESLQYSYSFDEGIQQEWSWTERYAPQAEILRYINFVADRLQLRRDIDLETRVEAMSFDPNMQGWHIQTDKGEELRARFCIMATGPLSVPLQPEISGIDKFRGQVLRTSDWPHVEPDLAGKRVGLIGTGSSGVQSAPYLARKAEHLTVFQRTPNFIIPARNRETDPGQEQEWKRNYPEYRKKARTLQSHALMHNGTDFGAEMSDSELEARFEVQYQHGGLNFSYALRDFATNPRVNAAASDFIRRKMAERINNPELEEKLIPKGYPLGSKRPCVDTDYLEIFQRANVDLVDLQETPILKMFPDGIRVRGREIPLDILVLATGFDAMTGALKRIEIRGIEGETISDKWNRDPRSYLGIALAGFPNMFLVNGPGSPSVFTNFIASIEEHINWIFALIEQMRKKDYGVCAVSPEAEAAWFDHVNEVGSKSLLSKGNSWYIGANVPGKPRAFLPYAGGAPRYLERLDAERENGFKDFCFDGKVVQKTLA